MRKIFGNKYDYLTLSPSLARTITHEENYKKSGTGKQAIRKIYYGVRYDEFEMQHLSQLKQALNGVAAHYPDEFLFRFLYSFKFIIDDTVKGIKAHEEWLEDDRTFQMTPKAQEILEKGIIYLGGRDKKFRPSVVFQCGLIDSKTLKVEDFLVALNTVFMIATQYMFYPEHVENWLILIDTQELGLFSLPVEILKQIIGVAAAHYVGNLERLYILNPSTMLNMSWSVISKFIDERSRSKIQFLTKKEFPKLLEYFDKSQLEPQFGGTLEKVKQYWPPLSTIANRAQSVASSRQPYAQKNIASYQAPFRKLDETKDVREPNPNLNLNLNNSLQKDYFGNKMNNTSQQQPLIKSKEYHEHYPMQDSQQNKPLESSKDVRQISFQDNRFQSQTHSQASRQYQPLNVGKFENSFSQDQSKTNYYDGQSDRKSYLKTNQPIIEEEGERKSHYISDQKNPIEEPTDRKYQQQVGKSQYKQDYQFQSIDFRPPYPEAIPKDQIVMDYNEQKKPLRQSQQIKQSQQQQQSQQLQQSQGKKNFACFSARDSKYTACAIF